MMKTFYLSGFTGSTKNNSATRWIRNPKAKQVRKSNRYINVYADIEGKLYSHKNLKVLWVSELLEVLKT